MRFARIHLICRKLPTGNGFIGLEPCLHSRFDSAYISGQWSIAETDAQKLLGGLIFLHEAKTKTSQFGGLIYNWFKDPMPDKANPDRISFKFLAVTEGRYAEWGGRNFMMAWQSEVVPENEEITWNVPPLQRHVGKGFRSIADIPEDFISDLKQRSKVKIRQ